MDYRITKHGQDRKDQRGFVDSDIKMIVKFGTPLKDSSADSIFLRNKDAEDAIREYQRSIKIIERKIKRITRLRGSKVVLSKENKLITIHHNNRKHGKNNMKRVLS